MWISKKKLNKIIKTEIDRYVYSEESVNNKINELIYRDSRSIEKFTHDNATELYDKYKEEIKKYALSTEFLLAIVEVIRQMQLPKAYISQEERDALSDPGC